MQDLPVIASLIAVYALAIVGGSWFMLPTERRTHQRRRLCTRFSCFRIGLYSILCRIAQKMARAHSRIRHGTGTLFAFARLRWRLGCIALVILIGPAVLIQMVASNAQYEDYVEPLSQTDPVIASLLRGERLVAPSAMPPELFSAKEVERDRRQIALGNREWELLEADFRQRLLTVYRLMAKHGYQMMLVEGYRSPERQTVLAKMGTHVTYAGAYQSYHQYGLAADSAFYKDGKLVISEKDPWAMEGYRLYGQYAESVGLVWGGKWQMRDLGHVELRRQRLPDKSRQQILHLIQQ